MAIITDVKPQRGSKSRVSIFLDGEFFCGLDKLTAAEFRLKTGSEVDAELLRKAAAQSEKQSAFNKALNYLSARARCTREIQTYLRGKGYSPEAAEHAISKLTEYGYLSDADYCRSFIEEYGRRYGEAALRAKLYAKGIDKDTVNEALENTRCEGALNALCNKYVASHGFNRQKLVAYLMRKGFGYGEVCEAVDELNTDEDAPEDYNGDYNG